MIKHEYPNGRSSQPNEHVCWPMTVGLPTQSVIGRFRSLTLLNNKFLSVNKSIGIHLHCCRSAEGK